MYGVGKGRGKGLAPQAAKCKQQTLVRMYIYTYNRIGRTTGPAYESQAHSGELSKPPPRSSFLHCAKHASRQRLHICIHVEKALG
jgi:hypothetical protein